VDSSPPSPVDSGPRTPRIASSPDGRRISHAARGKTNGGWTHERPVFHDGTERPINCPKDPEDQQEYYSGEKKCHTVKNLLVIDEARRICFLSDTYEGTAPDKSLAELAGYPLPRGSCLYQDRGFQGFTLDGITSIQPKKKPPGGELTPPEKAHNHEISSVKMRIEHAIGGMKRHRIVKDKIRLFRDGLRDAVMETCCGLFRFRLQYRPWNYANS
jgi:hypothetical protein